MNDLISRQAAIDALEWKWAGKAAMDAIKNLPSAQTWIPVTERLPEEYKRVLVSDVFVVYIGEFVDAEEEWGGKHFINEHGMHSKSVTAWMPLPELYEGDRKTEPTISKMEQVEDEPQTERSVCDTCQWYNSGIPCGIKPSVCKREVKDEPTEAIQGTGDCDHCSRLFVDCDGR